MQKIYNNLYQRNVTVIMPGEFYASKDNELVSTLLGSCIAVCLFDEKAGIGGMNHFLLPEYAGRKSSGNGQNYSSARYGISAMEHLIMEMQLLGADRTSLQAKVFGGGHVLSTRHSPDGVGERNIRFIRDYLKMEKIKSVSEDTGGDFSRKILFNTEDYSVRLSKIPVDSTITRNEEEYMERVKQMQKKTEVVYF